MTIRFSDITGGGTPFGDTDTRPTNPLVGQTYYNGQLGYREIYTVSGWIPATGANDFSLNITGLNTTVTFSQTYSSGSYSIVSFLNDASVDVYAYAVDGSLAGYSNAKAFTATQRFNKMVILGGSPGDVLQFSYKTTYATSASTTDVTSGPYITSITPSGVPNQNDTITITGGNFASDVAVTFTGTGYSATAAKSVVRSSSTSLLVTRPDNLPVSGSPYTITVSNPGVTSPTGSAVNTYSPITAGAVPIWQTSSTINSTFYLNVSASITLSATDSDGSSAVTYSYVSGTLPTGISFDTSTGVMSGIGTVGGQSTTYTVRATDSGGNTADREFTVTTAYPVVTGGTLTSDSTYYYRAFTGNGTLSVSGVLPVTDLLMVAGGGGGGYDVGAGAGAGGVIIKSNYSIPSGSYAVAIGAGGPAATGSSSSGSSRNGQNTTLGSLLTAIGGGGSGSYQNQLAGDGGSGGGGISASGYTSGGAALQPSSSSGGFGYPGGTGYPGGSANNYSGYAGGGGAGGAGGNGVSAWSTAGDRTNGCGGVGIQASWVTGYGDPDYLGWFAGGGGASTDTPTNAPYMGWGYGGKGGGGDGANRTVANGAGTGGYYYIDGKPNTGGGGGGGGSYTGSGYPGNNGQNGGVGGSGFVILRYTKASVGG